MCISERMKAVLEVKGLNIKTSAELFEMPYRTLQNYLLGERDPNVETLIKFSTLFNVDINWILLGQGSMFIENVNELNETEQKLIKTYRKLTYKAQEISLMQMIGLEKELNNN